MPRCQPGTGRSTLPRLALLGLALSWLLASCASLQPAPPGWEQRLAADLEGIDLQLDAIILPFRVSEAARAWALSVPAEGSPRERLDRLLARMTDAKDLGLRYQRGFSGTADEVFERREANCLGFVNLFVGLARVMGIEAYFVAIEDQPLFDREGDLVLVSEHVAAGFSSGKDLHLLDFTEGPTPSYEVLRPISDLEAIAKYYSNRGAELLQEGQARPAVRWLEAAVTLTPSLAPAWVNLGVARRRSGNLPGAEEAYRTALEHDPAALSAYQNLAALLRLGGKEEEAIRLLALTDQRANRNPFSYLALGDWNLEAGRLGEARRFYRRAAALDTATAEPFAAMGLLELAEGKPGKARKWLHRAQKLDRADQRTLKLQARLAVGDAGRS